MNICFFPVYVNNMADTRIKFTMLQDTRELWTLEGQGPDDREMIVGMASAIDDIVRSLDVNPEFEVTIDGKGEKFFAIDEEGNEAMAYDHYAINEINDLYNDAKLDFAGFAELQNGVLRVPRDQDYNPLLRTLRYRWIAEKHEGTFGRLVTAFRSANYIRGFIMGCNACGVDFRTQTHGKPFTVEADGTIKYYDIQGYPIVNPPDMPTRVT